VKQEAEHGTLRRYQQGCHCQECRAARAVESAKQRQVYRLAAAIDPNVIPEHGTLTAYAQWGCRCEQCASNAREYDRVRRARKREAAKANYGYSTQEETR
jgi:hypothetical protein